MRWPYEKETRMGFTFLRSLCLILAGGAILLGGGSMVLGHYFAYWQDNYACLETANFGLVAGAVLIGSGLISLAVLASDWKPEMWR
jgi:hypothetical protein